MVSVLAWQQLTVVEYLQHAAQKGGKNSPQATKAAGRGYKKSRKFYEEHPVKSRDALCVL